MVSFDFFLEGVESAAVAGEEAEATRLRAEGGAAEPPAEPETGAMARSDEGPKPGRSRAEKGRVWKRGGEGWRRKRGKREEGRVPEEVEGLK